MSIVIPLPFDANSLITEYDLGRGYALDKTRPLLNPVFRSSDTHTNTEQQQNDHTVVKLVIDEQSIQDAIGVGGEISLSYGLIAGRVLGDYLKESSSSSVSLTFLCCRRIRKHILVLSDECPLNPAVGKAKDLQALRKDFGGHYIRKIQYGAALDIKITLESSDTREMEKLKGELEGSLSLGLFQVKVKAHLEKTNSSSSSKVNVTSEVWLMGSEQVHRTDIKDLQEALDLINNFKVDEESLVPIAIEVAPIPPGSIALLGFSDVYLDQYMSKVKAIGMQHWTFEGLVQHLLLFKVKLAQLANDLEQSRYAKPLLFRINAAIDDLKGKQETAAKFLQASPIDQIASELPYSFTVVAETSESVLLLVGKTILQTDLGSWKGPSIDGKPIYKGTYIYSDGTVYSGYCLDGKRTGSGELKFPKGNADKFDSISGCWIDDEVAYKSTIKFEHEAGVTTPPDREINTPTDAAKWREEQRAKKVAESVIVKDVSSGGENSIILRVLVDKNRDKDFQAFYHQFRKTMKQEAYYFMFMGMTGAGKTTMVEYFLNVLTGQVHAAKVQRARDLEAKNRKQGESATLGVCKYDIRYVTTDPSGHEAIMFRIVLVDTPGFGDTGGMKKDQEHAQSILKAVAKLPVLHGISYVVAGSLTRTTLDQISTLCNVFSILPKNAFECVSSIVTFCDNKGQAEQVRGILDQMLPGIAQQTLLHMDNPWSHHVNNIYRGEHSTTPKVESTGAVIGNDNTGELEQKLKLKSDSLIEFVMSYVQKESSFSPEGMAELGKLKAELLEVLEKVGALLKQLEPILQHFEARSNKDIKKLMEQAKATSLVEWTSRHGFALINGKPMAKIVGKQPFDGGVYATVCFAPDCSNMTCHIGCSISFTSSKGDTKFRKCTAFKKDSFSLFKLVSGSDKGCQVCPHHCSYKQHVHAHCQLEWVENDHIAVTWDALRRGLAESQKHLNDLQQQSVKYKQEYQQQIAHLSKLKGRFKQLSVLGDMRGLLEACKRTYEQERALIANMTRDASTQQLLTMKDNLIDQLSQFLKALDETEVNEDKSIIGRIEAAFRESTHAVAKYAKKFNLI